MIKLMIKWFLFAFVIVGTCYLPGITVEGFQYAMLIAAILTIINVFIKPVLKLIAFPINLLTLGAFNLVINFGILYAISYFIPQYRITNWTSGFIASIIIAIFYSTIKRI